MASFFGIFKSRNFRERSILPPSQSPINLNKHFNLWILQVRLPQVHKKKSTKDTYPTLKLNINCVAHLDKQLLSQDKLSTLFQIYSMQSRLFIQRQILGILIIKLSYTWLCALAFNWDSHCRNPSSTSIEFFLLGN